MSNWPYDESEKVSDSQLRALKSVVGFGAMVVDLASIDASFGRHRKQGSDTWSMWTMDGHRIDVTVTSDGGCLTSQTQEPDPNYLDQRAEKRDEG